MTKIVEPTDHLATQAEMMNLKIKTFQFSKVKKQACIQKCCIPTKKIRIKV
jgi:hypothetical protein